MRNKQVWTMGILLSDQRTLQIEDINITVKIGGKFVPKMTNKNIVYEF